MSRFERAKQFFADKVGPNVPAFLPLFWIAATQATQLYVEGNPAEPFDDFTNSTNSTSGSTLSVETSVTSVQSDIAFTLAFSMVCEVITRATHNLKEGLAGGLFETDADEATNANPSTTKEVNSSVVAAQLVLTGAVPVLGSFMLATPGPIIRDSAPWIIATLYGVTQILSQYSFTEKTEAAQALLSRQQQEQNTNTRLTRLSGAMASLSASIATITLPIAVAEIVERLSYLLESEHLKDVAPHVADGLFMAFSAALTALTLLSAAGNFSSKRTVDHLRGVILAELAGLCTMITEFGHQTTNASRFVTPLVGRLFLITASILCVNTNQCIAQIYDERSRAIATISETATADNAATTAAPAAGTAFVAVRASTTTVPTHHQEIASVETASQVINVLGRLGLQIGVPLTLLIHMCVDPSPENEVARKALEAITCINAGNSALMFTYDYYARHKDVFDANLLALVIQCGAAIFPVTNLIRDQAVAHVVSAILCSVSAIARMEYERKYGASVAQAAANPAATSRSTGVRGFLAKNAYKSQLPINDNRRQHYAALHLTT